MAKKNYYDITNLLKTGADYFMLLGQRANGKSYQVKDTVLKQAVNGKKFVYLRRWKTDLTQKSVEDYFADMPLTKYMKGYEEINVYQKYIYFVHRDEDGNIEKDTR